jgi:signal-transduction protein with cAMP-binding, CBS, and nucleotidyltransferase domain
MNKRNIIRIREVMKTKFETIDGLATVRQALELMKQEGVETLIVNKRHDDDEYGMVIIADIAREVLAKNRSPDRVSVYEIMTKPAVCVPPEMDIRYASRLLSRLGFARAPVVEGRTVVGTVSFTDMVLKGLLRYF